MGNLKPHKNPELVFAALAQLPELRLIVVTGDRERVAELAHAYRVERQTSVLGSVDDDQLAELYRGAAALAFPSIVEGFGLPVLEALKCGTPVVYLRECRSVNEICAGGQFAVDSSTDGHEFADACLRAISSPVNPPDLSRFDWGHVAQRVNVVLDMLREADE
ncbi:glycosyltransferase [Aeromicrobium sp. zg-Y869]|nr:glycosyltransferase [Aeromicrobium wangtongii]